MRLRGIWNRRKEAASVNSEGQRSHIAGLIVCPNAQPASPRGEGIWHRDGGSKSEGGYGFTQATHWIAPKGCASGFRCLLSWCTLARCGRHASEGRGRHTCTCGGHV